MKIRWPEFSEVELTLHSKKEKKKQRQKKKSRKWKQTHLSINRTPQKRVLIVVRPWKYTVT